MSRTSRRITFAMFVVSAILTLVAPAARANVATTVNITQAAQLPMCTANSLTWAITGPKVETGELYYHLRITNSGAIACYERGYPGLQDWSAQVHGHGIGQAATRTPMKAITITLNPGKTAFTQFAVANPGNLPPNECGRVLGSNWVRIYAPDSTTPKVVHTPRVAFCSKQAPPTIEVIQAGK